MNTKSLKNISTQQKIYLSLLILSMSFFIRKGIQYALLESYIPLASVMLVLLMIGLFFKKKTTIFLRLWAILLFFWSIVRIILTLTNYFITEITNGHIYHQIGLAGFLISLIFLCTGVYLFKKAKSFKQGLNY